ncbi:F-box domain-containing protein [Mycena sanguinolenta]|uniref:F-box domain-containing protein n=1 Tax=Mycena sanguinolenta TaxID=230812 RepID=A0A8H7DEY8_9AGAR|nr:F-box domain-containing protein [Mycena sanguinolenta]
MSHNRSASSSSLSKRIVPLSIRHALDIRRFESSQHRRKRLEAARLNDLAPISCLPPELLCHIFLFCASSQESRGLGWLPLTHVTHHWREVALACPELWANIIFHRKLAPLMLSRSKDYPLVIGVDLDKKTSLKAMYIREHLARVGALDVRGSQNSLDTFFVDHVKKLSAPRLRSLAVANTTVGDPLWLDAKLFYGTDERVNILPRQLRLERAALPWNSPWYNNLTDLYLADLHKAHGPTITMLLSVIVTSPLLQHLTLINTQTSVDDLDMYRLFPFALPDLRTIRITEPISLCAHILTNLTFPSIVTIDISCLPAKKSHRAFVNPVLCHRDFWKSTSVLRIDAPPTERLSISTSSSSTDKTLHVEIHHGKKQVPLEPTLESLFFCRSTVLSGITTLDINTDFEETDSWRRLYKCRNLTTLTLRAIDPQQIFSLLFERAMRRIGFSIRSAEVAFDVFGSNGAYNQPFPKLECIHLIGVDCGEPKALPGAINVLRSLLWARRAGRCPIPRVRFETCKNVFQQDVDHLRFLTTSFTWDGVGKNEKEKEDNGLDVRHFSLNVLEQLRSYFPSNFD